MASVKPYTIEQLVDFIMKAKIQAYAGDGKEVKSQRPGFKELVFSEGDFSYRDSYVGFFMAPGQEVVRFNGLPVWVMAYSGGMNMKDKRCRDVKFAKQTFAFLKEALLQIPREAPFRGPKSLKCRPYEYLNSFLGDVHDFNGEETIFYNMCTVFTQRYIGGIVINKSVNLLRK